MALRCVEESVYVCIGLHMFMCKTEVWPGPCPSRMGCTTCALGNESGPWMTL